MGTVLIVISGLGIFCSIGAFVISLISKCIFSITKNENKLKRTNKTTKTSLIAFCIFLIIFIIVMIVAPKLDPAGWCTHEYSITEQQDASCTNSGHTKKVCSLCNSEIIEIIEPYHLWVEDSVTEATCTTTKQIKKKCTRCEKIECENVGEILNHSWISDSVIEATCSHPKQLINKCSVCGTTETIEDGFAIPHSFGDWTINIYPTADTEGQQTRECMSCKYVENASIPKITYIEVTANNLWNAFNENEVAAEQKYNGKTVQVTGVISDINSADTFISANILLKVDNTYFGCVQCNFDSNNATALANLHKGESVTIEGTCGTISLYNLIIMACKVIE